MAEQQNNPSTLSSGSEDIRHCAGLHVLARIIARKHAVRHLVPTRPEEEAPRSVGSDRRDKDRGRG
jgi:hypothetical protein